MPRNLFIALAAATLLAGCSHTPQPRAEAPRPVPARADTAIPGEPAEAVWHLRAGLNVAALSCRGKGRVSVAPGYARVLARHKTLLARAYAAEERRYGQGFDRHQTKLYNQFSNQRSPEQFCRTAASVAGRAAAMDSAQLAGAARALVAELD